MTTPANNKQNVSTIRGAKGGYLFCAPVGTAGAPTKATYKTWTPGDGWENLGYIPEDGFTESVELDSGEAARDINLETVDQTEGPATESLTVGLMEIAKNPLAVQYGLGNVTDENGTIEVVHNWSEPADDLQFVFLLILKNNRIGVKYIPDGKRTALSDLTGNKKTVAQREVTITYITDENGAGCYDWFESNETPAPALSALSGTGITLNPTFDATKRAYTATSSSSSTTLTATAASGNTVSIKDGNGNTYSSGGSIPLVTGKNALTVIVTHTDSGAKGLYTLEITKS